MHIATKLRSNRSRETERLVLFAEEMVCIYRYNAVCHLVLGLLIRLTTLYAFLCHFQIRQIGTEISITDNET